MEEVLRERILEGKYEPDSAFPTENELCQNLESVGSQSGRP